MRMSTEEAIKASDEARALAERATAMVYTDREGAARAWRAASERQLWAAAAMVQNGRHESGKNLGASAACYLAAAITMEQEDRN